MGRRRWLRRWGGALAGLVLAGAAPAPAPAPAVDDPIRPTLHFTPQRNWINDPNGLVYHDGEWHLFFQYNPYGDRWGHMSWGHAVSRDLVHWSELPIAIPEGEVAIFSGSAVIDRANTSGFGRDGKPPMVAMFTGWTEATGRQAQYLAYSNDGGRSFTRWGTTPVIDIGSSDFRDPKVFWDEARRRWAMVLVLAGENKVAIYSSPDLKRWTKRSEFGPRGVRVQAWECPDLFPLPVAGGGTRWVMAVSVNEKGPAGGSAGQYFVGDFDGDRFTLDSDWGEAPVWMDRGADFYAAVSWNGAPDGRRTWIGWANDWRYARNIPTFPDRGAMSLPRDLSLRRTPVGWRIVQTPVAELAQALPEVRRIGPVALGEAAVPLAIADGPVDMTVEIAAGDASQVALALTDADGRQTLIGVNPPVNEAFVDRTRSSAHFHDAFPDRHTAPAPVRNGTVRLRVIVDRSIVELFADDGAETITDRFYPAPGPLRWSAYARGKGAAIRSLEVRSARTRSRSAGLSTSTAARP